MKDYLDRIYRFSGSPREIGLAAGRALGEKLAHNIDRYIGRRQGATNMNKLHQGALPWLRRLPQRIQDEYEGLAEGANLPLQRLAEWAYIEECESNQCSGSICRIENRVWVARNNDTFAPDMWGYVTIRQVDGRIPTISFSMEGDVGTPTGINQDRLWLHYNYLPVWDVPAPGKPHMPGYVFLTEALERCRTIRDVEALLGEINRDGGMLLFAVDGKTEEFALFECTCANHFQREASEGWIVGTNHCCVCPDQALPAEEQTSSTLSRFRRIEYLVQMLYAAPTSPHMPADLIRMLADDAIESRGAEFATAYANVACPSGGEIWYTFGGYPAASEGNWQRLEWPWTD
jgi:hypothetical protein